MGSNRDLTTGKQLISWITINTTIDISLLVLLSEEFIILSNLDNPDEGNSYAFTFVGSIVIANFQEKCYGAWKVP